MGANAHGRSTFLLTVFNARLGVGWAIPASSGEATWTSGRRRRLASSHSPPSCRETTDATPTCTSSDGGHFENLALYEMVLRRCRYIILSDAGCDGAYTFGDLANAVRKIRVDFGVDIEFAGGIRIGPGEKARFAIGTIRYSAVDSALDDGVLLYLKPTVTGDEPVDVANYARAHAAFPHESTAEQWFSEAQFESYRMLGLHTVTTLCRGRQFAGAPDLVTRRVKDPYEQEERGNPGRRLSRRSRRRVDAQIRWIPFAGRQGGGRATAAAEPRRPEWSF